MTDLRSTDPTMWEFTDDEYAVMLDALSTMRDNLDRQRVPHPILDEAIRKFTAWAKPTGCEFLVVTGTDMQLLKDAVG